MQWEISQSLSISVSFCTVRIAVLKLWNFTLDFTFSLSEIFFCSCPQQKQKSVSGLKLERQLALYPFMTCTLKNYFIMDSFSHQPFPVNTVKCFRIRPISITESCIFILFFTRPILLYVSLFILIMLPWIILGTSYFSECEHILEDKFGEILVKIKIYVLFSVTLKCFLPGGAIIGLHMQVVHICDPDIYQPGRWSLGHTQRQVSHNWKDPCNWWSSHNSGVWLTSLLCFLLSKTLKLEYLPVFNSPQLFTRESWNYIKSS